jgi:hypothetical protein
MLIPIQPKSLEAWIAHSPIGCTTLLDRYSFAETHISNVSYRTELDQRQRMSKPSDVVEAIGNVYRLVSSIGGVPVG